MILVITVNVPYLNGGWIIKYNQNVSSFLVFLWNIILWTSVKINCSDETVQVPPETFSVIYMLGIFSSDFLLITHFDFQILVFVTILSM